MKKQISLLFILAIPAFLFSQTVSENITEAEKLYQQKSYKQSMQMLDKAKKEIESIYLEELKTDLLPAKIEGYTVADKNTEMGESFVLGNNIQLSQTYYKEAHASADSNPEQQDMPKTITISISNSSDKAFEVSESYSMAGFNESTDPLMPSPIEFKEYRAIVQYEEEMKQGRFLAIIGAATIEIQGNNIDNKEELLAIANSIELEKIIKTFGK